MHRFHLPPAACQGATILLDEAEAHHAARVLRLTRGDRAVVLDGAGHELLCEVTEVARNQIALAVRQRNTIPPLPYRLTLIQAITKGKSMDLIVQKATELGVSRIVPVISERSVTRIEPDEAEWKVEKWRTIAVEAIKQCGSAWLPEIVAPVTPAAFLAQPKPPAFMLLASLQPGATHPRELLRAAREERRRGLDAPAIWIGPEGDFTPAELNQIRAAGALPITLGPLVLRSETAALYCLSFLAYELQAGQA